MAFKQFNCRLPEEYIEYIKEIAGKKDESQSYMIQQAIFGMGSPDKLPLPKRRDKRGND